MRIVFIGQKGVPARHGGVERHVEELGSRLVGLGHEVVVFTRPNYSDPGMHEYRGMRLVSLPTIGSKHLDAMVHSVLCSLYVWGGRFDVVHYHAIGPCLASALARLRGRTIVATIHGQDWRRAKWGKVAALVLRMGEWMALHVPHATICVSKTLSARYLEETGRQTHYIPNGISIFGGDDDSVLEELGVEDGGYLLFAGRIVPEKGLHHLLRALTVSGLKVPLVVAGDTSYSDTYVERLQSLAGPNVMWAGYVYGDCLASLFRHAALFVLPSDLEGLPIVLLEALGYGVPVLASDIPPNVEVLGDHGTFFAAGDVEDLAAKLSDCMTRRDELREAAVKLKQAALVEYDWDRLASLTMEVYESALKHKSSHAR